MMWVGVGIRAVTAPPEQRRFESHPLQLAQRTPSDSTSFTSVEALHGLSADEVRAVIRQTLKSGSHRTWRKRARQFSDNREIYK